MIVIRFILFIFIFNEEYACTTHHRSISINTRSRRLYIPQLVSMRSSHKDMVPQRKSVYPNFYLSVISKRHQYQVPTIIKRTLKNTLPHAIENKYVGSRSSTRFIRNRQTLYNVSKIVTRNIPSNFGKLTSKSNLIFFQRFVNMMQPGRLHRYLKPKRRFPRMISYGVSNERRSLISRSGDVIYEPVLSPYSIKNILENIALKYDDLVKTTIEVIDKTVESNEIVLMKMTAPDINNVYYKTQGASSERYDRMPDNKKIIFIVHGLNVDGIKSVWCLYKQQYFEIMLTKYISFIDMYDIFLIPVANPDGLAQSTTMSYWAKNNSPQSECPGVFLDRNFAVKWNTSQDINSCHPQYPGPMPFSEAESRAIRSVLHAFKNRIRVYLNVHAVGSTSSNMKGEAVLFPRGYTKIITEDVKKYMLMKKRIDHLLKGVSIQNLSFQMTTLFDWYGKVTGTSVDYAAEVCGIPYSLELAIQPYEDILSNILYNKYVVRDVWEKIIEAIFTAVSEEVVQTSAAKGNVTKTKAKPASRRKDTVVVNAANRIDNMLRKAAPKFTRMKKPKLHSQTKVTIRFPEAAPDPILSPYSIKSILMDITVKYSDSANITIEVLGKTVEYNEIVIMKMTALVQDDKDKSFRSDTDSEEKHPAEEPEKKIIFIVHGLNVDGITSVWCLYKLKYFETLLITYIKHLDNFDVYLIPVANPDGLSQTGTSAFWAKNNSPQSSCPGVFLDRNFDIAWNETRDINSCHPRYPGPSPFSEAESRAIRDVLHQYNKRIIAYLNVHAHGSTTNTFKGEAVLYPRGYSEVASDEDKYVDIKGDVEEVLKNVTLQDLPFEMTTLYNWYGKISGSSVDYAAQVYGVPYSLEIAMQPYEKEFLNLVYNKYVLGDLWEKVLDVIFISIHNSLKSTETN